jgi:glycosyltransferase involved in cell wall biosynthesis
VLFRDCGILLLNEYFKERYYNLMITGPLVSVGVPSYNKPSSLAGALKSITNQSYQNIEIFISDDASPDPRIKDVVRSYQKKDSRIRYVLHEINRGGFFNFEYVLSQSSGKYFMWAADDDLWDKTYIEKCLAALHNSDNLGMVFPRFKVVSNRDTLFTFLNHNWYLTKKHKVEYFLLLDECLTHKANLLYGLWRTKEIKAIWAEGVIRGLGEKHMGAGFDNAFLTLALSHCNAFQIPEVLFYKRYLDRRIPGSIKSMTYDFMRNGYLFLINPVKYVQHTRSDSKQYIETIKGIYNNPDKYYKLVLGFKRGLYIFFRYIL